MVVEGFTCRVPAARSAGILVPVYDDTQITHKFCYQCRKWKIYDDFNRNRSRGDGRCSECRECEGANKAARKMR